ncbi:MAG: uridine monophosphate kinase, partial [Patescibacteria group bacterium]
MKLHWKRILLKLSGEAMGGKGQLGLDIDALNYIAREIKSIHSLGCRIGIVIGGGNFIRGQKLAQIGIDRTTADYMGMLGTAINALALQDVLERAGMYTRVLSSLSMIQISEPFIRRKALRHLEKGRIVIFSCGTGNPYFSTDTAAALRASEINAQAILKATNVRGIFQEDPKLNAKAKFLPEIDALNMLKKG